MPLALNEAGRRLAKRDGAVTLEELRERGRSPEEVLAVLAGSLRLAAPGEQVTPADLLTRFGPALIAADPWIVRPDQL